MTNEQKDLMLYNILEQVQEQIVHLVNQDLIQESYSLYKEWEEHFNDSIQQIHILSVIDLTAIW